MEEKVKDTSETLDKTIKVEDDSLKIKMKELETKVNILASRMNMLLIKFSTTHIVKKDITSCVPIIEKSSPTTNGSGVSNVTLVCRDNEKISAHKLILLPPNSNFKIKKLETNNPDKMDVSLAFEDDKKIKAHSTILSYSSFQFDVEKKENANVTLVYEDLLQKIKLNTQGFFIKVKPAVFQYESECQCAVDKCLQQYSAASPPNSSLPSPPQHQGTPRHQGRHGQHSRGQVQGECYYERGGYH